MVSSAKRPLQPDDLYLLKTVSDPRVSPDGQRLAYVLASNDLEADEVFTSIWVVPLEGASMPQRFTFGNKDMSPRWSPDGQWLAFVSKRGEENQVFAMPASGGEARQVTNATFGAGQPAWSPDSSRLAFVARSGDFKEMKDRTPREKSSPRVIRNLAYRYDGVGFFDERRQHIFVVDIQGGKESQLTDGDWNDIQPSWSPDGTTIVFVSDRERDRDERPSRGDVWAVKAAGGRARKLTRSRGAAAYPVFSPDGRYLAFVGHENGDKNFGKNSHLLVIAAEGGQAPTSLSAPLDRPVAGLPTAPGQTFAWSADSSSVLFLCADHGRQSLFRAGVGNGSVSKVLGGERFIDSFVLIPGGQDAVFIASSPAEPGEVWSASLERPGKESNLSRANDELLAAVRMAEPELISYKSADGTEIEALVLYPPGFVVGRSYPAALQIHGGPHGVNSLAFTIANQSLAAAGNVVLLPNPRGSAAYGEEFAQACIGDWGGRDFEDLMAGVDELVRRKVADSNNLYIGGYSFGGFMTSWAVGQTNRFRSAVVGAPVADRYSMFGTSDIPLFMQHEVGAWPFEDAERYLARSPITYLRNVQTPVLLIHMEGDMRCPIGQSEEIFQTLKVLGREVEFVRYPGGFHGVATPSQLVDRMRRTRNWHSDHASRSVAPSSGRTKKVAAAAGA